MRLVIALLFAAGCAEAPPVKTTLPIHSLKAPEQATQEGITIGVEPITHQSVHGNGQLMMRISWMELDRNAPVAMGASGNSSPRVSRSDVVALVPLPTMHVTIHNQSPKTLRFKGAHIDLSDGTHHWSSMDSAGDVQGRVEADIMGSHSGIGDNHSVLEPVSSAIAQLPLVTPALTVAAGQTWEGYICVKGDAHDADEFNDLMDKTDKLTLSLSGLELDGAAAPGFSFVLPRETQQKQVTCPGDLKKPSIQKCKEG